MRNLFMGVLLIGSLANFAIAQTGTGSADATPQASLSVAADVPSVPERGESLQSFVPAGYKVGIEVRSDFNGDGRQDIAALLWVSPNSTTVRPFIILLRQADSTYRLSARADYFTITEVDNCGVGNPYCVPDLRAKGRALIISKPSGSAAGYGVYENEFRLVGSTWYRVRHASYGLGNDLTCPKTVTVQEDERCIEQGISVNDRTGVLTDYCKFVDYYGNQTRAVRTTRNVKKMPLRSLLNTEWEDSDQ